MSVTALASLFGGIGLFLLGMRMMTDGLKLSAGNALRSILQSWTRSNLRGLMAGALITAIVQSSSAVTVATVGFVNAELLTLAQAVWVVFGANVGTTMTGWLVALVGVKVDVGALALPMLGAGMLLRLTAASSTRRAGFGEALAGFGAFFLGVGILQATFTGAAADIGEWPARLPAWSGTAVFVAIGAILTMLTQSSSAAIAIALTAAAGGTVPIELAAPAVVGTNIGTTSTALFAALGATAPAKRVAVAHIAFNLLTGAAALALLPVLLAASARIAGWWSGPGDLPATLAVFHTLFNLLGVLLIWPVASRLVRFLSRRFVSDAETLGRPVHLDATMIGVPSLAVRGVVLEVSRMRDIAFDVARRRVSGKTTSHDARRNHDGIMRLGQELREFLGAMSKEPLPDDVVAALPDLLRAIQHIEDVIGESAAVGAASSSGASGCAFEEWSCLHDTAASVLRGPDRHEAPEHGPGDFESSYRTLEHAYEGLKAKLLRAAATGRVAVEAMEDELLHARRLRRMAESALRANRRLAPWLGLIDDRTERSVHLPEAARGGTVPAGRVDSMRPSDAS